MASDSDCSPAGCARALCVADRTARRRAVLEPGLTEPTDLIQQARCPHLLDARVQPGDQLGAFGAHADDAGLRMPQHRAHRAGSRHACAPSSQNFQCAHDAPPVERVDALGGRGIEAAQAGVQDARAVLGRLRLQLGPHLVVVRGNRKSNSTPDTYSPDPPTRIASAPRARIPEIAARAASWYQATAASSVTSRTSSRWCGIPRRSAWGSFAGPDVHSAIRAALASALTTSAGRPAPRGPRRGRATGRTSPVPVAPTTAQTVTRRCAGSGDRATPAARRPPRRRGGGDAAGLGLRGGPTRRRRRCGGCAAALAVGSVPEEVERGGVGDRHGDHVTGARHVRAFGHLEVHEPVVLRATRRGGASRRPSCPRPWTPGTSTSRPRASRSPRARCAPEAR